MIGNRSYFTYNYLKEYAKIGDINLYELLCTDSSSEEEDEG
jgi:hypothetical protein